MVQAKWKRLCGEEVSLFGDIADSPIGLEPLFLDEDLCARLFGEECALTDTWGSVALRALNCNVWPPCVRARFLAGDTGAVRVFPPEIWQMVVKHLSIPDILSLASVCHEARDALFDFVLSRVLQNEFPDTFNLRSGESPRRRGWQGAPCALLLEVNTTERLREWMQDAKRERYNLLKAGTKKCVEIASHCSSAARCGGNVVAGFETELVLFGKGRRQLAIRAAESPKLLASSHEFVCAFGKSDLRVYDSSLSLLSTLPSLAEGAFSADVCGPLLAIACGPEMSLVDVARAKVLFGKPELVVETRKQDSTPLPPPSVASDKYVAAPPPQPDEPEDAFLELGSCVQLCNRSALFLTFIVNDPILSCELLQIDLETQSRNPIALKPNRKYASVKRRDRFSDDVFFALDTSGCVGLWDGRASKECVAETELGRSGRQTQFGCMDVRDHVLLACARAEQFVMDVRMMMRGNHVARCCEFARFAAVDGDGVVFVNASAIIKRWTE